MDVIELIKNQYPQVIAKNIDLSDYKNTNALGFVISDEKFIIGYITKEGTLKKILNPMDISQFDTDLIRDKIPVVYSTALNNLEELIKSAKKSNKKKIDQKIFKEETVPLVLYDELQEKYLLIEKKYQDKIMLILQDNKIVTENKSKCIEKIENEKEIISKKIQEKSRSEGF